MAEIGIFISILLIGAGFFRKNSRRLFTLQCIWLWILHGLSNGGMDYQNSVVIYNSGGVSTEWLSRIIIRIFRAYGFDYLGYHAVMSLFAIAIFAFIVRKYSKTPCLACSLYFIFLIYDNVIQKRFFLAAMIALLAFHFWLRGKKALYYLTILAAMGFHIATFVFLFFPWIQYFIRKNSKIKILALLIVETLAYRYLPMLLSAIKARSLYMKYQLYMENDKYSSVLIGICFFSLYAFFCFAIIYLGKYWESKSENDEKIMELNQVMIFILPFLLINSNFARYFRTILIFDYIFIGNRWTEKVKRNTLSAWVLSGFIAATIFGAFAIRMGTDSVSLTTIFENNWLFNQR